MIRGCKLSYKTVSLIQQRKLSYKNFTEVIISSMLLNMFKCMWMHLNDSTFVFPSPDMLSLARSEHMELHCTLDQTLAELNNL